MDNGVMQCIRVRTEFFEKYYTVPVAAMADVDRFVQDLYVLGEASGDAQAFEANFAAQGYQDRFNCLLLRCTPKAYQMTAEEKAQSQAAAKEIFREDRSRIMKEAAQDALDYASVMAEEEVIAKGREKMIEAGVFDNYTRKTNAVDMMVEAGSFLKKLFGKK